jgi:hypothetical protein
MASNIGARAAHVINKAIAANTRRCCRRLVFDTLARACIAAPRQS